MLASSWSTSRSVIAPCSRWSRAPRPDGYLLVEDADPALQPLACLDEYGPEQALANKLRRGFRALLSERGVDLAYGRRLPRLLRESGLVEVAADAYFPVTLPASARLEAATIRQLRDALIERGLGTPEELERHLTAIDSGRLDLACYIADDLRVGRRR